MRTTNPVWKRLLSLAMVLFMVLGYVPGKAAAADTSGALMTCDLTRTEKQDGTYEYGLTVRNKDTNNVTEDAEIVWPEGEVQTADGKSTYSTDKASVKVAITYQGMKLNISGSYAMGVTWELASVGELTATAGSPLKYPTVTAASNTAGVTATYVGGWTVKDKDGREITEGTTVTSEMGTLTATSSLGDTYKKDAIVTLAKINVDSVTPAAGWCTALPGTVTVTGSNSTTIENSEKATGIDGVAWNAVDGETGKYVFTFTPEDGKTYTINGHGYTWNVDAETPSVEITKAYVNNDNQTVVEFNFSVGKSNGTVTVTGASGNVGSQAVTNGSGTGSVTLPSAETSVTATIANGMGTSAEPVKHDVDKFPEAISYDTATSREADGKLYVNGGKIAFNMPGGIAPITWKITKAGSTDEINVNECSVAAGDVITVTATDAHGRIMEKTLPEIAVDSTAPVITIGVLEKDSPVSDESSDAEYTETYGDQSALICQDRTYQISVSDDVALGSATATLTYTEGEPEVITLTEAVTAVQVASDKTLKRIVVTATDWTGANATTITRKTNVTTDANPPVITGEITVEGANILNFFTAGGKNYLKLDPAVEDGNGVGEEEPKETPDVTVTVKFTVTDANRTGEEVRTETYTVKKNEVVEIPLAVSEVDKAGNPATAPISITLGESTITLNAEDGSYSGSLWVDRRAPEDVPGEGEDYPAAPVVTLKLADGTVFPGDPAKTFTQDIELHVNVTDQNSGLPLDTDTETGESKYTFTATYTINNISNDIEVTLENGVGSFTIPVTGKEVEDNNCTVNLTIKDSAGNAYSYKKIFAVDSKAPVVTLNGTDVASNISQEHYYEVEQELVFTITDLNPATSTVICIVENYKDSSKVKKELTLNAENGYSDSLTLKDGDKLTQIVISAADQHGNQLTMDETLNKAFEVDTTKPEVVISGPTTLDGSEPTIVYVEKNKVYYYDKEVSFTVKASDHNFKKGSMAHVINDMNVDTELEDGTPVSFTVVNGQTLSALTAAATDLAGWTVSDSYGNVIAVDTTAPRLTVSKSVGDGTALIDTVDGKAYYNGDVTFHFTIEDEFLDPESVRVEAKIETKDGTVVNNETRSWDAVMPEDMKKSVKELSGSITIANGQTLQGITITAKDMYGRNIAGLEIIGDEPGYNFETTGDKSTFVYKGPQVVVDTGAPDITVELSGNIDHLQYKDGVYYIHLKKAVDREDGEIAEGSESETVTLKITVTDLNLSTTSKHSLVNNSKRGVKWILGDGEATYTETFTVNADESKQFPVNVTTVDMLGHETSVAQISWNNGVNSIPINSAAMGGFQGTFLLDRRTPTTGTDSEAPKITLTDNAQEGEKLTVGDLDLYKKAFTFTATVTDGAKEGNAGLMSVTHSLDGATVVENVEGKNNGGEDTYTVNIPVEPLSEGETDSAKAIITAVDNVGNTITYTKTFAFDNQAPRIKINFNNESPNGNGHYNTRIATVEVTDLHIPADKVAEYVTATPNGPKGQWGTWQAAGENTYVNTYTMSADGAYRLVITAKDILDNTAVSEPISFVVDNTAPTVTVERVTGETPYADNIEVMEGETSFTADFYQSDVVYRVTVEDLHFEKGSTAILSYTIRQGGTVETKTVELVNDKNYGTTSVSYEIPLTEGQMLTNLSIQCKDDVNNWAEKVTGIQEFTHSETDGKTTIQYTGHATVVKNKPPQVTVTRTRTADMIQGIPSDKPATEYFDTEVTYTVLIQDVFLKTEACSVKLNGTPLKLELKEPEIASGVATAQVTFTVTDKDGVDILEALEILAIDRGGMTATMDSLKVIDMLNGKDTGKIDDMTFEKKDQELHYTGPKIIVDTKAPTATLTLSGKVDSIVEKNGVYYVKLTETVDGKDGIFQGADQETVKLTLVVTDKNLTLDKVKDNTFISSAIVGKNWTLNGETATYTDTITAKIHDAQYIKIDVSMFDLARHGAVLKGITWGSEEKAAQEGYFYELKAEGTLKGTVSLDRRTPSTVDENTPKIELTDNATSKFKALNGLDLYGGSFAFDLFVTDSRAKEEDAKHAGLQSVSWTLTDGGEAVTEANKKTAHDGKEDYVLEHKESVQVNPRNTDPGAETDQAALVIDAIDNVGNKISYKKTFAFDNLAPRVTVTVSGESVRNNEYFNQNRTAVVEIEDLHMPDLKDFDQYVTVDTQGTPSGWVQDGIVYRNTYTFDRDGEYTIDVTVKDILGNTTEKVDYKGEHPQQFVVDKTHPIIQITYDPTAPVGNDNGDVDYYAKELTAYVTITERNFSAADVAANFVGGTFALTNWTGNLDHSASVTFGEGNNYSFTIDYVDLAGNRAVTQTKPTFSVDTTAPTITITRGSLENKGLNIVQGDLTLSLTIHDEQDNLSGYDVEVIRLDNTFKSTEVEGKDFYTITPDTDRTTVVVDFAAIAKEKGNDGVYTVKVTASDYAGNTVELTPELVFSLNRFGSTFTTNDDYTKDFLAIGTDGNAYHASVDNNLVIQEINPNMVWRDSSQKDIGSMLTVVVNGTSTQLEEGKDYALTVTQEGTGENSWFVFTYEIKPDVFRTNGAFVDGRYSILLYSEDEAGNKNTNESNEYGSLQKNPEGEYTGKVEFTLDTTPPIITTTGIEDGKTYNEEFRRLDIFLSDNTPYQIVVYLNDTPVILSESMEGLTDGQAWLVWDESVGGYVLNVPEQNTLFGDQNVRIVATDAAGNSEEHSVEAFHISTNLFVRFVNSVWFIIALAVLLLLLIALVVLVLVKRRNKAAV